MLGNVAGWIALRYLVAKQSALSYVSRLALFGLALSVAVLVLVLSVVNGFERELRDRILALIPHITVSGYEPLEENILSGEVLPSGIRAAAQVIEGTVLLAANGEIENAQLTGVNAAEYKNVTIIERFLKHQSLEILHEKKFGIIVGASLAHKLNVKIGDNLLLVMPFASITPAGAVPRQRRFTLLDIIDSKSQLDQQAAYISLATAQKLFKTGTKIHGLHIRAEDLFQLQPAVDWVRQVLQNKVGRVSSWQSSYGSLYQAIAVQKLTMFILLSFLVGVAAFNLVSGLMMIVVQRQQDIAILRTLGAGYKDILLVFIVLGATLAGFGIFLGLTTGALLATLLPSFFSWLSNSLDANLMSQYFISYLPVDIRITDIMSIGVASLVLSILAIIYPAIRATKLLPGEVLAHE